MKPTIRDVAKEANVSVSTVSRVINGRDSVHESTKKIVLDAIEKLGFVPNKLAQSLTSNSSNMVAVFVPHIGPAFYGQLLEGIESQAGSYGYRIIFCNTQNQPERELDYLNFVEQYNVDGIIVASDFHNVEALKNLKIPAVTVDHILDETYPSVTSDNVLGGELGIKELIDQGCKNILLFRGPSFLVTTIERTLGVNNVLEDHPDIHLEYYDFDLVEPDLLLIEQIIKNKDKVDGIFSIGGDTLAIATISILKKLGYKLPKDIKIVGFDNSYFSSLSDPKLTTIEQSPFFMGKRAFQNLYDFMKKGEAENFHDIISVKLIKRESSKKA